MNISGQTVMHKVFGQGTIADSDSSSITVDFGGETKRFIYPQAFSGYLTAVDPDFGDYISGLLRGNSVTVTTVTDKPKIKKSSTHLPEETRKERYENFISSAYSMWSEEWEDNNEEKWF